MKQLEEPEFYYIYSSNPMLVLLAQHGLEEESLHLDILNQAKTWTTHHGQWQS